MNNVAPDELLEPDLTSASTVGTTQHHPPTPVPVIPFPVPLPAVSSNEGNIATEGTMLELMRLPNMRRKFCILTFLWLANSVAYNGLSYNSSNLGVSDTLAFFINAIVEAPAYVLTWWAMGRWGRRWPVCLTMLLGGLACCACMFVPEGIEASLFHFKSCLCAP